MYLCIAILLFLTMFSLDSLLDDINTIDKDTKSAEVKTIKFTPHPPTTGKGKDSSQQVEHFQTL